MTVERERYVVVLDDKRNLATWIKSQFPHLESFAYGTSAECPEFAERALEVYEAAMIFLSRVASYPLSDGMRRYYEQDIQSIPKSFNAKDWRAFAKDICSLVDGIELE